jgi:adenosine 3'-phospho 5'-phosphosulfate transporter B2
MFAVEEASDSLGVMFMQLRLDRRNPGGSLGGNPGMHGDAEVPEGPPRARARILGFTLWAICLVLFTYIAYVVLRAHCGGNDADLHEQINAGSCFVGLSAAFLVYGIIQEYIMTRRYRGGLFPSPEALIFCNRLMIIFTSGVILLIAKRPVFSRASTWAAIPAVSVFVGSACQYRSLHFITFPTHVGMKSAIIVPTMLLSSIALRHRHSLLDYFIACLITGLVIGFNAVMQSSEDAAIHDNLTLGVSLMTVYLVCEAFTTVGEKWIFNSFEEFGAIQMMMAEGTFSCIYSFFVVSAAPGFRGVIDFISQSPLVIVHIIGLAICSTLGQFFIYYVIRRHGPVAFAVMMTLKQVFAMMFSSAIFNHPMPLSAYLLSIAAFLALLLKHIIKAFQKKPDEGGRYKAESDADAAAG